MTLCLMEWNWRVLRAGPCFPDDPICSFFLSPTILSFYSFNGLVVWGWGLRIESVLTFYRPSTADSILIIIIIIIIIIIPTIPWDTGNRSSHQYEMIGKVGETSETQLLFMEEFFVVF